MDHRPQVRLLSLLGAAALFLAAAPGVAGKKEMEILQADVDEIQRQVFDLKRLLEQQGEDFQRLLGRLDASPDARKQMADFNANVEALRGDIRSLATRFDATAERLQGLERKVAVACVPTQATAFGPPGLATLPGAGATVDPPPTGAAGATSAAGDPIEAAFQRAYGDYIKDSFDLAVAEFQDFIAKYPQSDLADNAQYWMAMSAFNRRQYDIAIEQFDALLTRWPEADQAPEAMYRKGLALLEVNRLGQAVLLFNDVVSAYPDHPAARQASDRLRELASGER